MSVNFLDIIGNTHTDFLEYIKFFKREFVMMILAAISNMSQIIATSVVYLINLE